MNSLPFVYKNAILAIFAKYAPGMRINRPGLVSLVVDEIHPMGTLKTGTDLTKAQEDVEDYLQTDRALGDNSVLVWSKGKGGGISLRTNADAPAAVVATVVSQPTRNEKPCFSCTRNNDVGAAKCWWCESPNPTNGGKW